MPSRFAREPTEQRTVRTVRIRLHERLRAAACRGPVAGRGEGLNRQYLPLLTEHAARRFLVEAPERRERAARIPVSEAGARLRQERALDREGIFRPLPCGGP